MPREPIHLRPNDVIRFEAKFEKTEGCWQWAGCGSKHGYGYFSLGNTMELAHRISYTLYVGPIPPGLCVLHRCDNPKCVNPAHLWLGTNGDNIRDRTDKGRSAHGEHHGRAKLTIHDVLTVLEVGHHAKRNQSALGRRFGVSHTTIRNILNGKRWVCEISLVGTT